MSDLYQEGLTFPSITTLMNALTPEDSKVLAYLNSCSSFENMHDRRNGCVSSKAYVGGGSSSVDEAGRDHTPLFDCNCFRCYKSFWERWNSSPNRQIIDEIKNFHEEWLSMF